MNLRNTDELTALLDVKGVLVSAAAINTRGQIVCCLRGQQNKAVLWDAPADEQSWAHPVEFATTCAIAEDGAAYVGDRGMSPKKPSVLVPVKPDGKLGAKVKLPLTDVVAMALSPDGAHLAVTGGPNSDEHIYLLSRKKPREAPVQSPKGHAASANMKRLAWTATGWLVSMAETKPYSFTFAARRPETKTVAWRGAGQCATTHEEHVATWTQDGPAGKLEVWQPGAKGPIRSAAVQMPDASVAYSIASIESGRYLAVCNSSGLFIIDASSHQVVSGFATRYWGTRGELHASPDGKYLMYSCWESSRAVVLEAKQLL